MILTATDPFGTSISTEATGEGVSIQVKVNTPPMHQVYGTDEAAPAGKKEDDPVELSDIADKDLSVSAEPTGRTRFHPP